ncbi:MAG: hypothetical protein ABFS28_01405 [Bacteroidota bacterium]
MKKVLKLTGILLFAVTATFAQTNKEEIEFYQSIFGMEKKAVVDAFVGLEGDAADQFWGIYDAYETERKANGQKRIELLNKYTQSYLDLDDATTDALAAESMKINAQQLKLIKKYYKQVKRVSGSKTAAQFYQLENYFRSAIQIALMEQIPFIGEFDW